MPELKQDLTKLLELPLLEPEFSEDRIAAGCALAKRLGLAAVIVRPCDLDSASRWTGPDLALSAAIDWPHGYATSATKQYGVRDALRRGAREIMVTMNTGKLLSRQFQYLEMELLQVVEACRESKALLTVNLESQHLTEEHKIVACRIAKRVEAHFLATPNPADIAFFGQYTQNRIELKLREAVTLDAVLEATGAGCKRIETPNPIEILEAWKNRLAASAAAENQLPVENR